MAKPDIKFKLSITCMTYNQSKYIVDALNGFVMQQTEFPYVATIVDDASTDAEQKIILNYLGNYFNITDNQTAYLEHKEYGDIHFAQHNTNKNCYFAVILLKENHFSNPQLKNKRFEYCKEIGNNVDYIAICEGDDYWTDPKKLQRQVDFLDEHPQYSCCSHQYKVLNQNENSLKNIENPILNQSPKGYIITNEINLSKFWTTKTLTIVYRKEYYNIPTPKYYKYYRDVHKNYHILKEKVGYCLPDDMGVYRKNDGGIFGGLDKLSQIKTNFLVMEEIAFHNQDDSEMQKIAKNFEKSFLTNCIYDQIANHQKDKQFYSSFKTYIKKLLERKQYKNILSFFKICSIIYKKRNNFYRYY